ncbi:MAG: tetratricopeptide repeat protein [Thermoanaerobaculia bacterium]
METDQDRPDRRTYVEPPAAAVHGSDLEAAYRARHARLCSAGRFERLVREGGMGAVLEVRGTVLGLDSGGGRLAVKLIKERLLGEPEVAARFRRELASHQRLSASFQVPRLLPCLALSEDDDPGLVFGVFPFYPDGALEEALDQGLTISAALWILADAVEGLQSLHGLDYVHRDFHPSNILIDREGGRRRGVLGDLGVGIFLRSNTIFTDTQLGADSRRQVGHRGYIDPFYRASPQADLYAVGATLYRILAGRAPAGGRSSEIGVPEGALTLPTGVPVLDEAQVREAASALLVRLTAPDEGDRYASVREARVDLVALAELVQRWESEPFGAPVVAVRRARRRSAGRRLGWIAAVTALVVSSSALTLALSPRGPYPVPDAPDPLPRVEREPEPPHVQDPHPVPGAPNPLPQREREPELSSVPGPSSSSLPQKKGRQPEPPPSPKAGKGAGSGREGVLTPSPVAGEGRGEGFGGEGFRGEGRGEGLAPATEVLRIDPLIRARRHVQAEALSIKLWTRYPADPEVAGRLALILQLNHGEDGVREARTVLAAALDRHPGRGDLRLALARVLLQLEPPAAARSLLTDAPLAGTHVDEIKALRVTLVRRSDQSQ